MLGRSGAGHTGSLLARSYLDFGEAMDLPGLGAIAVLSRGSDPNAGHVEFYLGETTDKLILLGGNQGDSVSVEAFDSGRLLGYRWPAERANSQVKGDGGKTGEDLFATALHHVLEMEGGFTDVPYDRRGPTNKGITLAVFAGWRGVTLDGTSRQQLIQDLKRIDDATAADIYLARYWQPSSCALLPAAVALMHFDASVNHGVGGAIRLLQAALAVNADGEFGPQTLQAARIQPTRTIVERYADLRRARYRALPQFWRFGRGWLRRVDATEALAMTFAGKDAPNFESAKGVDRMDQDYTFPVPGEIPGAPMPGTPAAASSEDQDGGKWWLESKTVWGTLITALSTVLPIVGPLIGINLPVDIIQKLGDQVLVVIQALAGLFGTLLAIYGRTTAVQRLVRRQVSLKM
jgi:lysozyme family protein